MRRSWLVLLLALVLWPSPPARAAAAPQTAGVQSFLDSINRGTQGYLPPVTLGGVGQLLRGGPSPWSERRVVGGLWRYLLGELRPNLRLVGQLVVLAALCALLQKLQGAFAGETVGKLAYAVCYLALLALAVKSFSLAVGTARGAVDGLTGFMAALFPTMVTLLAASGALVTAGLLHPVLVAVISTVGFLAADLVLPLLVMAALLEVAGSLATGFSLSGVAALLRQGGLLVLGLGMSAFLGVLAVEGAVGPVSDGVALRSGKFLSATFIPVVGKLFSDATEAVFGSSLLLKNVVGVAGVLGVAVLVVLPLLKLVAVVLAYRLAQAAVQPMGAGPVAKALGTLAHALTLVTTTVLAVAVMFFLTLTVLLTAANPAVG